MDRHLLFVAASAFVSIGYVLPSLIGVARHGLGISRLLAINVLLGWTVIGWCWAMALACRPPHRQIERTPPADWTPWMAGRPESPAGRMCAPGTYRDGTYLISAEGAARTWAVFVDGRWGVAYELDGTQRTAAWVDSTDLPIEVLARALVWGPSPERRFG